MLYRAYEMTQAAISPMRTTARFVQAGMQSPINPMAAICRPSHTSAALEIFLEATRRYAKPEFGLSSTLVDGVDTPVLEQVVWAKPFCRLLHFRRMLPASRVDDPKVLIVAPMSGHYATLLRGTVEAMLPHHDVFITDWTDARNVPLSAGRFDLDDYTDYLIEMLELIAAGSPGSGSPTAPEANPGMPGPSAPRAVFERIAVLAVCQPGIPVMAAASLMAEDSNPARPSALVLMGSPIDTACNPKQPNEFARKTPLASFERNAITRVPWPYPGFGRRVYPGFLQLSSFLAMNLDRHLSSHLEHFNNLVRGDGDSASDAHRRAGFCCGDRGGGIDELRGIFRQPEIIVGTWRAARAEQDDVNEDEAWEALLQLDPLWDEFFPAEQAWIVQLLVERVDVRKHGVAVRLAAERARRVGAGSGGRQEGGGVNAGDGFGRRRDDHRAHPARRSGSAAGGSWW